MNKIIGITIGPVYKTMTMARKTREFWGASFLISKLSQAICNELRSVIGDENFIVPCPSIFEHDMMNYGLYLDRIIVKTDDSKWSQIDNFIDQAFKALLNEILKVEPSITVNALKGHFKVYAAIVDENKDAILDEVSTRLNSLEMYNKITSNEQNDWLIKSFMDNVNTEYDDSSTFLQNSFLESHFDQNDFNGNCRIPSIVEIATNSISKNIINESKLSYKSILNRNIWKSKENEHNLFIDLRESYENTLKNHHKYIAILQADGDRLGKYLMQLNEDGVKNVSKELINWGKDVFDILTKYGALSIYIGGDDVMCFAPINNVSSHILDLAFELNASFKKLTFTKESNAALSIGIKICYYKSPMGENYADTFPLLRDDAKNYEIEVKAVDQTKLYKADACAVQFDKHSGQPHKIVFNFQHEYTDYIKPIIDSMNNLDDKKSFLNSIGYFIRANENVILLVASDKDRFCLLFENNFNEAKKENKNTPEYKFINSISDYLQYLCLKYKYDKIPNHEEYKATTYLYSTIKIIKLIKGLDQDHE